MKRILLLLAVLAVCVVLKLTYGNNMPNTLDQMREEWVTASKEKLKDEKKFLKSIRERAYDLGKGFEGEEVSRYDLAKVNQLFQEAERIVEEMKTAKKEQMLGKLAIFEDKLEMADLLEAQILSILEVAEETRKKTMAQNAP